MIDFEKYKAVIHKKYPDYKFSWEIYTELILRNINNDTLWLDLGAGLNIIIREQPGAKFAVGIDKITNSNIFLDNNSAFCAADMLHLPFKDNSFDFITSRYAFEHLEKPESAFAEASRVLRQGGIFVLQTTNCKNPMLIVSRMIPGFIKAKLLRVLFGAPPSGIFKTYYRSNTPGHLFRRHYQLEPRNLILVEDILCHSKFLFLISYCFYKFIRAMGLVSLSSNIIVVFEKKE